MKLFFSKGLVIFFLLIGGLISNAQVSSEQEKNLLYKHAIGAGAGFTTGYGLSYRYIPSKWGFQINFAPYYTKETERYSIGLTALYRLIESKVSSLFLYEGNHFYYDSYITYYDPTNPQVVYMSGAAQNNLIKKRETENFVNNGIGVGIEFIIVKRIGFNLMGGYAFYRNFEQLNFTGETGLYYKF